MEIKVAIVLSFSIFLTLAMQGCSKMSETEYREYVGMQISDVETTLGPRTYTGRAAFNGALPQYAVSAEEKGSEVMFADFDSKNKDGRILRLAYDLRSGRVYEAYEVELSHRTYVEPAGDVFE